MLLLSGRRARHITFWLTLLLNQLWTRTPQFSWLACRKEEWWCWEKANLPDQGRTISNQSVYSIKIQSHENSGAIQYWTEEMTRKHPPDEASCFWELASAQLLFLFRFYSSTFLLKFSLSDTIDVHVCVHTHTCTGESICSLQIWTSKRLFQDFIFLDCANHEFIWQCFQIMLRRKKLYV